MMRNCVMDLHHHLCFLSHADQDSLSPLALSQRCSFQDCSVALPPPQEHSQGIKKAPYGALRTFRHDA
ncbi:hypothetical protein DESPIG_01228 [Desulfovibrio piger ATCC 29098]|uniref:Uncharacterized protein n=1 Tax=Desulfovibrio piger ATCC 29098 TaxID=411464 RepID=B6WT22_9BACT|nr:hypothetical protein DESPIG_01228 [Desulfovibrio piger ATCC 29098]